MNLLRIGWSRRSFPTLLLGILFLLCLFTPIQAQQFRFDHWTVDQGLPQNSVYGITQTPDGYLWMTTFDGLVRFDGIRLTVFNRATLKELPSSRFFSILSENDGSLWASTEEDGVIRYHDGNIQVFNNADGVPIRQSLIQKDLDGSLLVFANNNELFRWRDGQLRLERKDYGVDYRVYAFPGRWRWELDKSGFLRRTAPDGSQKTVPLPFDLKELSSPDLFTVEMFEDRTGVLWLAAAGNLYRINGGAVTVLTKKDGMPPSQVVKIREDAEGFIWLSTIGSGVCQIRENRFNCYDKSNGLTANYAMDIFSDREGTLWITTNSGGINHLTKQVVTTISTKEGLSDKNIYSILQDRSGAVWLGGIGGLAQLKDGRIKNYPPESPAPYQTALTFYEDREGRLWVGNNYVGYWQNGVFTDFTGQLNLGSQVTFGDIQQDRDGAMWFATNNQGLIKFQDHTVTRFTAENGLPTDDVRIIYERRDGSLVIGTYKGFVLMTKSGEFSPVFTEKDGLAGNSIRTIYEDADGVLWFGTYDTGLSRFKDGKFTNYGTNNGLFSNGVFAILEDNRGSFWMSSNQGIYRVSKQELNDLADGRISKITSTSFGKSDGMLNAECNGGRQPSAFKDKDGKLWFPTQDGLAIIDPEAVPRNPNPPPVVIESAVLSGTPVNLKDKLEIEPSQDNLEIRYTGLSFIKPEQIRFRYKLEGLDENWTEAGARRTAYYPYLPPGKYTFRVIAANSDNVWNEQGAALEIVVHPAFYQTWWFSVLTVLAIAVLAFWLYRRRIAEVRRKQLAQEEFSRKLINAHETERHRIAGELHDSLGQHLVMIKNSAVFGTQLIKNVDEAITHLGKISEQSTQAIAEVREISHNLRPYLLEHLGLTKAVKALLNKIAGTTDLTVNSKIEDVDGIFAKEAEMSLYRIIQESLNNILKHAAATQIDFMMERDEQLVKITISDNGHGFEMNGNEQGGFGLLGMHERVKMIGGTISIASESKKGTSILIRLNIP